MRKRIAILGATGSVGTSTLDLVERSPERFEIVALTAAVNVEALAAAARRTGAALAVVADERRLAELRERLSGSGCRAAAGDAGLVEAATAEADLVMAAIVGCAGLVPTMAAIRAGRTVALANKEALVSAGALMMDAAARSSAVLLPVDSEHNAIFQCLAGSRREDVARLILTASGGPFLTASADRIRDASPAMAVAHPKWSMGAKISVDSATLMNKGLELIEAHHLFGVPSERLDVLVHPQSIVHSLVEFVDGSVLAQLGAPDMRIPIACTLAWPERMATPAERLDLASLGRLEFEAPDLVRFPSLGIARDALEQGGSAPAVLNAANEVAVGLFLRGAIGFGDIARLVESTLERFSPPTAATIDDVVDIDRRARATAEQLLEGQSA